VNPPAGPVVEGSELRRALIGLVLGVAFGALIGLLSRRDRSTQNLA
jgi:ABC-type nitrate/sulfonate/bicarbonate transport system permease component